MELDDELLEEIELLSRAIVAASLETARVRTQDLDAALGVSRVVAIDLRRPQRGEVPQ